MIKKYNLPIPRPPKKDVQVTEDSLKREHPALQNMKFVGYFCPPGSGYGSGFQIRIRIH
jgi:hypothetical protein